MKIRVNTNDLSNAFKFFKPMIPKLCTLPILQNIKFKTERPVQDGVCELSATNLDIGGIVNIPADVEESGEITIPYADMATILTKLGKDKMIPIETGKDKALFGNTYIGAESTDEYPMIPEIAPTHKVGNLPLVAKSADGFASRDDTRHFLNGVFLHLNTGALLYSTDGKRLAKIIANETKYPKVLKGIVPSAAIRAMQFFTGAVSVGVNENSICFVGDTGEYLVSRLIEGDYPDAEAVITQMRSNTHKAVISISKLLTAYDMLSPKRQKGKDHIRLVVSIADKVCMSCESGEDLKHTMSVCFDLDNPCETPFAFLVNAPFFKDAVDLISNVAISVEISTLMAGEEYSPKPIDFAIPDGAIYLSGQSRRAVVMPLKP